MKLLSANIEGDRHLERIIPFVQASEAGIVCLQEVFEPDLPLILGDGWHPAFLPMSLKTMRNGALSPWGAAIATRQPSTYRVQDYFRHPTPHPVPFDEKDKNNTCSYGVIGCGVGALTVFTTHFTWTPDGLPDADQKTDMAALLAIMSRQKPHILCGDFNIPRRRNALYAELAKHYTDHVPEHFTGSLYLPLHYAARDPARRPMLEALMVDYVLSSTPQFCIENFAMHGGLSDHYAITADVFTH